MAGSTGAGSSARAKRVARGRRVAARCAVLAVPAVSLAACGGSSGERAATATVATSESEPVVRSAEHGARDMEAEGHATAPDGTHIPPEPQGEEPNKGTPGAQDATGGKIDIPIRADGFRQPKMQVSVGQIVVWTNEDGRPHTVHAAGRKLPRSGAIPAGGRFEYTAREPGRIRYRCALHPQMTGTLVVTAR